MSEVAHAIAPLGSPPTPRPPAPRPPTPRRLRQRASAGALFGAGLAERRSDRVARATGRTRDGRVSGACMHDEVRIVSGQRTSLFEANRQF